MRNYLLKDKENSVAWDIIPSYSQMGPNIKEYVKRLNKYAETLNTWNDVEVGCFVTRQKLGDYICDLLDNDYNPNTACFAVNKLGKPIGVVILSPPYDTNVNLNYIIVDANKRGHGLATRLLNSVNNNIQTILNTHTIEEITALIHKMNIASQQAFLKSGYTTKLKSANNKENNKEMYRVYTCSLRNKENKHNENIMD